MCHQWFILVKENGEKMKENTIESIKKDNDCEIEGVSTGTSQQNKEPIIINPFKKEKNWFVAGRTGMGMSFFMKKQILNNILLQNITKNHLNNNNWLKQHKKPMIRKGHPLYEQCKRNKGLKPFKVIVLDPKGEIEDFLGKLPDGVSITVQKGEDEVSKN